MKPLAFRWLSANSLAFLRFFWAVVIRLHRNSPLSQITPFHAEQMGRGKQRGVFRWWSPLPGSPVDYRVCR